MIKVSEIKKRFDANEILRGVSFEVKDGSIFGLIGRNGAGKTTLMNIMSGLLTADSGSCSFGDNNKKKVGYLPDLPAFYEYLTTDEYLDYLLMDKDKEKRNQLLELVGLPKGARIKTMSRGMRQRLGIAGVLVGDPDVILLDEPTSALDPAGRNDVKNILLQLKEQGKTIILSTHILADMDSICDRAGFLSKGVIAREIDIKESRRNSSEMIVTFAEKPDIDLLSKYAPKLYAGDEMTVRIVIDTENRLESQQSILKGLAELPQEIVSINSMQISLDSIFQEVCI